MTPAPEKTCSSCAHWVRQPPDPRDLAATVAAPQGQCRGAPPSVFGVVTGPNQLTHFCAYPTLPAGHPACGLHRVPLALVGDGD